MCNIIMRLEIQANGFLQVNHRAMGRTLGCLDPETKSENGEFRVAVRLMYSLHLDVCFPMHGTLPVAVWRKLQLLGCLQTFLYQQ